MMTRQPINSIVNYTTDIPSKSCAKSAIYLGVFKNRRPYDRKLIKTRYYSSLIAVMFDLRQ